MGFKRSWVQIPPARDDFEPRINTDETQIIRGKNTNLPFNSVFIYG